MPDNNELATAKPCPRCNSAELKTFAAGRGLTSIACGKCGLCGPPMPDVDGAVEIWNQHGRGVDV